MFKKKKDPASLIEDVENDKPVKKPKKKRPKPKCDNCKRCWGFCDFLKTSWKLFKEFSGNTSIHGIKYLTDKNRHWTEKLFWFIALSLSIFACSYLIYDTFRKWKAAPVIVSFSEKFMNIWDIPFAAITICPIAGEFPLNANYSLNNELGSSPGVTPLKEFNGSVETRITNAKWRNDDVNTTDLFTEIATEEGFCYTFNMIGYQDLFKDNVVFEAFKNLKDVKRIPPTQWVLQGGYQTRDPVTYPFRAAGSGENGGIKFEIWRKLLEVKKSADFNKGFKLVVHLPCEIPQFDKQYFRFPLEKSATLVIRPSLIVTEELTNYDSETRQCYFDEEKPLQFFKKYTRSNCQLECLAEFTRRRCNCIHYSMPRFEGDHVCDSGESLKCYIAAKKELMQQSMEKSLRTSKSYKDKGEMSCECLPSCTSLSYEGEISHDDIRYFGKYKNYNAFRSSVTIFFKDDDFLYSKRSELYSSTDFIANFGGILGLFLGVSILSIVEIIYFIAFRQLNDDTEKPLSVSESIHETPRLSLSDDTTIASVEIKGDEAIVRNGY